MGNRVLDYLRLVHAPHSVRSNDYLYYHPCLLIHSLIERGW